jgi:hypothetical protein
MRETRTPQHRQDTHTHLLPHSVPRSSLQYNEEHHHTKRHHLQRLRQTVMLRLPGRNLLLFPEVWGVCRHRATLHLRQVSSRQGPHLMHQQDMARQRTSKHSLYMANLPANRDLQRLRHHLLEGHHRAHLVPDHHLVHLRVGHRDQTHGQALDSRRLLQ